MRPIKFRGKRLDNGEWMEGGVDQNLNQGTVYIINYESGYSLEIDPKTFGQFTGLLDKNGVEIYEGDILGRHTDGGEIVPLSTVVYVNNGFFAQSLVSGADFNFNLERVLERQNAVGNIHDNPELLKNK